MPDEPIRVVIVDDSLVAREMLAKILSADPGIEVVGQARDGQEGAELVARVRPDLVTMDIHMPKMDGLQAVEEIMAYNPTPIMVVSSSVHGTGTGRAFDALRLGALEVVKKPELRDRDDLAGAGRDIIRKVRMLSRVKVITHLSGRKRADRGGTGAAGGRGGARGPHVLVAVGSSTGGPSALMTLLGGLPKDFPLPLLITQHIADGFIPGLVEWLSGGCRVRIDRAVDRATPECGVAYLAPTGMNLEFDGSGMRLMDPLSSQLYVPSADSLFSSVARTLRAKAVGIILTGMGNDGARGLKDMHDAGAVTLGQDEATCAVYGMPRAALEIGAVGEQLPIESMAERLMHLVSG